MIKNSYRHKLRVQADAVHERLQLVVEQVVREHDPQQLLLGRGSGRRIFLTRVWGFGFRF